jgi:hypothetical protein
MDLVAAAYAEPTRHTVSAARSIASSEIYPAYGGGAGLHPSK